jgi:hypothetical protein
MEDLTRFVPWYEQWFTHTYPGSSTQEPDNYVVLTLASDEFEAASSESRHDETRRPDKSAQGPDPAKLASRALPR